MTFKKLFEKTSQNDIMVIYDTRTSKQVGIKLYTSLKAAKAALEKMKDKEFLKIASQLFFIDKIRQN